MLHQDGHWSIWSLYPWLVLMPASLLLLLLGCNLRVPTKIGAILCGPPIRLNLAVVSLPTVMVALSLILATLSYSGCPTPSLQP